MHSKEYLFFIVLVLSIGVELRLSAGIGIVLAIGGIGHLPESGQSPETFRSSPS